MHKMPHFYLKIQTSPSVGHSTPLLCFVNSHSENWYCKRCVGVILQSNWPHA